MIGRPIKIVLTIPGEPRGKARPRFNSRSKHPYTPIATQQYEALIVHTYRQRYSDIAFPTGALDLRIRAYFSIPKSDPQKAKLKKLQNDIRPTKRPDMDNIMKIVADALNKVAYNDDAQIVDCQVRKFYADEPRTEISIQEIGGSTHE